MNGAFVWECFHGLLILSLLVGGFISLLVDKLMGLLVDGFIGLLVYWLIRIPEFGYASRKSRIAKTHQPFNLSTYQLPHSKLSNKPNS